MWTLFFILWTCPNVTIQVPYSSLNMDHGPFVYFVSLLLCMVFILFYFLFLAFRLPFCYYFYRFLCFLPRENGTWKILQVLYRWISLMLYPLYCSRTSLWISHLKEFLTWTDENLWLGVFWFKIYIPWNYKESVDLNSGSEFSHRSLHRELLCSGRGLVWGWSFPRQCFWFSPSRTCQSHKVRSRWKIL